MTIRRSCLGDLEAFYEISLATGHLGGDASSLYQDPRLMGHIYSAPYLLFSRDHCLSLELGGNVCGYIIGTPDTKAFENRLSKDWWPFLQRLFPNPPTAVKPEWTVDQRRAAMIHHPANVPTSIQATHPAHLHMNLLPQAQGRGLGRELLSRWLDLTENAEIPGIHVVPNRQNSRAISFWNAVGFRPIPGDGPDDPKLWLGRTL